MKYLSVVLALAAFSIVSSVPALSRTIHHPAKHHHSAKHVAYGATSAGPLYLYGGWSAVRPFCLSPASVCAGEASQR
jgi:hypothetical protein